MKVKLLINHSVVTCINVLAHFCFWNALFPYAAAVISITKVCCLFPCLLLYIYIYTLDFKPTACTPFLAISRQNTVLFPVKNCGQNIWYFIRNRMKDETLKPSAEKFAKFQYKLRLNFLCQIFDSNRPNLLIQFIYSDVLFKTEWHLRA